MFVLGKGCICFYLQVLVKLGALRFSRTDGSITTAPALLPGTNLTAHGVRSPHQTVGRGIILPEDGLSGKGELNLLSLGTAFPRCAQSSQQPGSGIRSLLRGLYQIRDGCEEFKPRIAEKSRSILWLLFTLFHQPETSSLWLQIVQSPSSCPSFGQFGLAPFIFFMEKQILSKSHFGGSEKCFMKNGDGCLGHLMPLGSGTIIGEL